MKNSARPKPGAVAQFWSLAGQHAGLAVEV
jgi:hypothetical protein